MLFRSDRKDFVAPDLRDAEDESDIYIELVSNTIVVHACRTPGLTIIQSKSSNSVLDRAGCTALHFLITPRHELADGSKKRTITINGGGLYLTTPEAKAATRFSDAERKKSKMPLKLLTNPNLARRSWNYLVIPTGVKFRDTEGAFDFSIRKASEAKQASKAISTTGVPAAAESASPPVEGMCCVTSF